VKSLNLNIQAS